MEGSGSECGSHFDEWYRYELDCGSSGPKYLVPHQYKQTQPLLWLSRVRAGCLRPSNRMLHVLTWPENKMRVRTQKPQPGCTSTQHHALLRQGTDIMPFLLKVYSSRSMTSLTATSTETAHGPGCAAGSQQHALKQTRCVSTSRMMAMYCK